MLYLKYSLQRRPASSMVTILKYTSQQGIHLFYLTPLNVVVQESQTDTMIHYF